MSNRNRRQIYSLLRYFKNKETEIGNTLGFVHRTHNFKKLEKNTINQDLKELYVQLKQAHDLLDEYIKDCTNSETDFD